MRTAGIIMECNPFHSGHAYIIQKAKEVTGAEACIVVMSGDFVQRGAPAIEPKESRVRDCLRAGADLVIELPLYYACSGAAYFAQGAVTLLSRLHVVTDLCFGVSSSDVTPQQLMQTALFLRDEPAEFSRLLGSGMRAGMTYAAARAAACEAHGIWMPADGNDQLGIEYCKALAGLSPDISADNPDFSILPMQPHAIARIEAPTASQLRAWRIAADPQHSITCDDFSQALLYKLACLRRDARIAAKDPLLSCSAFLDVNDDLSSRIQHQSGSLRSYTQFCEMVKTRNLTWTRVSRALLHILLSVRKDHMDDYIRHGVAGYARVLGMSRRCPCLPGELLEKASLPVIFRLSQADIPAPFRRMLEEDIAASDLYDLVRRQKLPVSEETGSLCDSSALSEYQKRMIII